MLLVLPSSRAASAAARPFYLGFFSSDLSYRAGVVFAEIDAIFFAVDVVRGRGEVVRMHLVSHCIQLAHIIILHSRIVLGMNRLGRLLLGQIYSLRGHSSD